MAAFAIIRSAYGECELPEQTWNVDAYQGRHSFVWKRGADVLELLAPEAGERTLDLGCGSGELTRRIADAGAETVGVDSSAEMIERARERFPELDFRVADARDMTFDAPFDAIFSNAALHWVLPPELAARAMRAALKPGGRLALELGGRGNIATIYNAILAALDAMDIDRSAVGEFLYFPSVSEYSRVLEDAGFEVCFATLFDRPTPLEDGPRGLRNWVAMFKRPFVDLVPEARLEEFFERIDHDCRAALHRGDHWIADYRRLRVQAVAIS